MMVRNILLTSVLALSVVTSASAVQPKTLRSRYLEAKPQALRAANNPGDSMPLRLFSDTSYVAVLEELEEHPLNGLIWRGHLADQVNSWVVMVERDGVIAGVIASGDRVYRVRYAGGGLHAIEEMDPLSLRWTRNDAILPISASSIDALAAGSTVTAANEAGITEIDVLMVYTNKAAKRLIKNKSKYWWVEETGAKKAIESQAMLAMAVTNAALENSKVNAHFRLVGVKKINGKGSGDFAGDLGRLQHPADSFMDRVHALRDQLGADFVVLILGKGPKNIAGTAYVVPASHPHARHYAFSVVHSRSLWWTTVAHELGHNMGLVHDPGNDKAPPEARSHPYARGYQNRAKGLATLMAYTKGCSACWLKIPHFSNPQVKWRGESQPSTPRLLQPACNGDEPSQHPEISFPVCGTPTGKKRFNCAKSISNNRKIFAGFRDCRVDCQHGE